MDTCTAAKNIQKHARGFLTRNKMISNKPIVSSYYQTKKWRNAQKWYKNGKSNECELFQRDLFENITSKKCAKSKFRINISTYVLRENTCPMKYDDGLEWSEDFDGFFSHNEKDMFVNFKFVCGKGGAQTRTLRELYHFVCVQMKYLSTGASSKPTYFLNILDGDECFSNMEKFNYLLNKSIHQNVKKNIFVGDMHTFQKYWSNMNSVI